MKEVIRVPKDRIGAVIGKKGKTRKKIEKIGGVKVKVDSRTGEVTVESLPDTLPENFYNALLVVKAIGRGFDGKTALTLFTDDTFLEIIDLKDVFRGNRNAIRRQKARLIGTEGSARKRLEELTGTKIRIYGDTVAIIGDYDGIKMAERAIFELLEGSPHTVVFRHLELERKRRKREEILRELGYQP